MGASWRVRRSSGRRHAAAVRLVLLLGGAVLSSGGLDDILDQDQNQDRLDAIGALYGESAVIMTRR